MTKSPTSKATSLISPTSTCSTTSSPALKFKCFLNTIRMKCDFIASIAPCRSNGRSGRRRRRHAPHALPAVKLKGLFELLSAVTESRDVARALDMKLAIRRRPGQLIAITIMRLTYLAHQPPFAPLEKPNHRMQPISGSGGFACTAGLYLLNT